MAFASFFGYKKDTLKSTPFLAVLKNSTKDEKIIISRDIQSDEYHFFNTTKDKDRGNIIDFIQNRRDITLMEVRKICKDWRESYEAKDDDYIKPCNKEQFESIKKVKLKELEKKTIEQKPSRRRMRP